MKKVLREINQLFLGNYELVKGDVELINKISEEFMNEGEPKTKIKKHSLFLDGVEHQNISSSFWDDQINFEKSKTERPIIKNQKGGKTTMSETSSESWDGLLTNFLKAENIAGDTDTEATIVCIDVEVEGERMDLIVEYNNEKFNFTMNKTNMVFLKDHGISKPKDSIGKKITVKKTMAMNPQLKKEVPTLRISKVE